jgi:tripartite-type tricarboxylate transporter receptor subunit TctC
MAMRAPTLRTVPARMMRLCAEARAAVAALAAAGTALAAGAALADPAAFPSKPVRIIVPFPPGGATDIIARLLARQLQEVWGQPAILDYKPGAGTVVGTDYVAKSAPDGYTLGMVITAHVINPSLRKDLPFDTMRDLSGVSMVAVAPLVLVATNSLPADGVPALIALAGRMPGKLSYATPGTGTAMHLAGELMKSVTGIDIVHIPYKGGAAAYPDVIEGRVQLQFDALFASMSNIRSGKVRALAVTGPRRAGAAPEIPAMAETLAGFDVRSISGVIVPAATPRERVHRISADVNRALADPELDRRMLEVGMEPSGSTPEQFDGYIRGEIEKWSRVVQASGAKPD